MCFCRVNDQPVYLIRNDFDIVFFVQRNQFFQYRLGKDRPVGLWGMTSRKTLGFSCRSFFSKSSKPSVYTPPLAVMGFSARRHPAPSTAWASGPKKGLCMITVSPGQVRAERAMRMAPIELGILESQSGSRFRLYFLWYQPVNRLKIGIRQLAAVVNIFLRDGKTGLFYTFRAAIIQVGGAHADDVLPARRCSQR